MKISGILFLLMILLINCQKSDLSEEIAFYSLKEYNTIGQFAIDESTAKLGNEVLISYNDLLEYNAKAHIFTIPEAVSGGIEVSQLSTGYYQKPFAVTIGHEIIYTGYFWSLVSSTACDWTTAVPLGNQLIIELGYPGPSGKPIIDRRNNKQLLEIFRRAGKLVE